MKFVTLATLMLTTIILSTSCTPQISQVTYDKLNYEHKQLQKRYDLLQAESDVTITNDAENNYVTKEQYERLQQKYRTLLKEKPKSLQADAAETDNSKSKKTDLTAYKYKRKQNQDNVVMATAEPFKENKPRTKDELENEVKYLNQEIEQLRMRLGKADLLENGKAKTSVSKKEYNDAIVRMTALESENMRLKEDMERVEKMKKVNTTQQSNLAMENERLLAQVEHYKEDKEKLQDQLKEITNVRSEKESMIFANLKTDREQLQQRVAELSDENKELRGEVSSVQRMADRAPRRGVSKREHEKLKKQLLSLQSENQKLREGKTTVVANRSKVEEGNRISKATYDELQNKYNQLERDFNRTMNEQRAIAATGTSSSTSALKTKVAQLESKNATLQRKIRSQEKRLTESGGVSTKEYNDLKSKYDVLKSKESKAGNVITPAHSPLKLQRTYDELKLKYDELVKQHRALEDRFNYLRASGSKGGSTSMKALDSKSASLATSKTIENIIFQVSDYRQQNGNLVLVLNLSNMGDTRTLTFNRSDIKMFSKEGRFFMPSNYMINQQQASKAGGIVKEQIGRNNSERLELVFNNVTIKQFNALRMELNINNRPFSVHFKKK